MQIQKIEISNFKSFKNLSIDLGKFNVLIGPNSAGKSNFIQIFKFLRDIVNSGLENAISMQGGVEYLRNLNLIGKEECIHARLEAMPFKSLRAMKQIDGKLIAIKPSKFTHEFSLKLADDNSTYSVAKDSLIQTFDLFEAKESEISQNSKKIGTALLKVLNNNGSLSIDFESQGDFKINKEDLMPTLFINFQSLTNQDQLKSSLLIENQYFMPHPESVRKAIGEISIYELDPSQPKSVTSIAGKAELEENGENLAIVLRKILSDKDKARKLFNLIKYVLPFVEDLEVEKFLDKYLQLTVKEKYIPDQYLPASLMSSGSLFIIAMIIVLYFENKPLSIFEEPARRIHPYLISKVIDMMKDVSTEKQIILSTHNPEIVKYAGLANIFFVSRDDDGFSVIKRPGEEDSIRAFLENEIGIEELFIQNLLS